MRRPRVSGRKYAGSGFRRGVSMCSIEGRLPKNAMGSKAWRSAAVRNSGGSQ